MSDIMRHLESKGSPVLALNAITGMEVYPRSIVDGGDAIYFLVCQDNVPRLGVLRQDRSAGDFALDWQDVTLDDGPACWASARRATRTPRRSARHCPLQRPVVVGLQKSPASATGSAPPRRGTCAPCATPAGSPWSSRSSRSARWSAPSAPGRRDGRRHLGRVPGGLAPGSAPTTLKSRRTSTAPPRALPGIRSTATTWTMTRRRTRSRYSRKSIGPSLDARLHRRGHPEGVRRREWRLEGYTWAEREDLLRAACKYGRALAHLAAMYRHLAAVMGDRPLRSRSRWTRRRPLPSPTSTCTSPRN